MKKILFILSILITTTSFSQTGNIRGFVYEKESGEPVIFCNVFLKGTTIELQLILMECIIFQK